MRMQTCVLVDKPVTSHPVEYGIIEQYKKSQYRKGIISMEEAMRKKLKIGFTLTRWGIDLCFGGLLVAIAFIATGIITKNSSGMLNQLFIAGGIVLISLVLFVIGRISVGLQARKLNFNGGRSLTDEERWFLQSMRGIEESAYEVNLAAGTARMTDNSGDNIVSGAAAAGIASSFNNVGKRYRSRNFFADRWVLLVSVAAAIIIAGAQLI